MVSRFKGWQQKNRRRINRRLPRMLSGSNRFSVLAAAAYMAASVTGFISFEVVVHLTWVRGEASVSERLRAR